MTLTGCLRRYKLSNNMDYKLARKLKSAGFPQEGTGFYYADKDNPSPNGEGDGHHFGDYIGNEQYFVKVPTLSELIKACGDDLYELIFVGGGIVHAIGGWTEDGDNKYWEPGLTPDEAVAKLWLNLRKK